VEKIRRDEKFKPNCCFIIPTGPTEANVQNARFNNSSNKIIHNFKQIPLKYKQKTSQWLTCFKFIMICL